MVGAVTRLTGSGLSMTYWKPHGNLPPMTAAEWQEEFERYKQFPEFKMYFYFFATNMFNIFRVNSDMTVDEFKSIYYMEWGHRWLGRIAGLAYAVPFGYFLLRGRLTPSLKKRLAGILGLFAVQVTC